MQAYTDKQKRFRAYTHKRSLMAVTHCFLQVIPLNITNSTLAFSKASKGALWSDTPVLYRYIRAGLHAASVSLSPARAQSKRNPSSRAVTQSERRCRSMSESRPGQEILGRMCQNHNAVAAGGRVGGAGVGWPGSWRCFEVFRTREAARSSILTCNEDGNTGRVTWHLPVTCIPQPTPHSGLKPEARALSCKHRRGISGADITAANNWFCTATHTQISVCSLSVFFFFFFS